MNSGSANRMRMIAAIAVSFLLVAMGASVSAARDLAGVWMVADGTTKVRMSPCGAGMCGNIVWLKSPIDQSGRPRTDSRNPDASKRNRPMIGLRVAALRPDSDGSWKGTVYNADEGKSFNVSLKMQDERNATMKGCVLGILCKNVGWTRAD